MNLRLGFHYHIPMTHNEKGDLKTPGYLGRFIDSLAVHCDKLLCFMHSPRVDELPQMDYRIESPNVKFIDIGLHTSVPSRVFHMRQITEHLRQRRQDLDIMLIRGPSPLLPAMAHAASPLPIALLLVGNQLAGISDLPQPRWRKEAIRVWTYWNHIQQLRVAKKSLTFVNSRKLYDELRPQVPNLYETRTTTLSKNDFFEREDTCQNRPIHLLYTGRMDRAKGLFEMVEAVDLLQQQGHDVVLDLVGWPVQGDTIIDKLVQSAALRNISERVVYHGYKAVGPELFAYYQKADIYLIASQNSFEGFPRTIWEAMAHSLPVVATSVGSIPLFLQHQETAWLVPPLDVQSLANGISTLIRNDALRQHLVYQGLQVARENTLENRAAEMSGKIIEWLAS